MQEDELWPKDSLNHYFPPTVYSHQRLQQPTAHVIHKLQIQRSENSKDILQIWSVQLSEEADRQHQISTHAFSNLRP